jgi:hypothetical protein
MSIDTPQGAAEERSMLSKALRDSIEEMYKAGIERADAEEDYELAYSTLLLKSEASSADKRKAEAIKDTVKLHKRLLIAEVKESYLKTRVRGIESDMKLLQTVAAGIRREYEDAMRGPS